MIPKPLNAITEADITNLKIAGIQEGSTIEYKRDLPGTRDEDKREFLADVSSFSNTDGGDILYGVAEHQGVITDVVGASSPDFDAEILRLESLIRDGVAPRMSAAFRVVPYEGGKVLVIRIEKSWARTHRVVFRGHDKFYARTSAGKFPLDWGQLRNAFLQSEGLSNQISGFRLDRLIDIANHRAPIDLPNTPRLVLHVIPLRTFSGDEQIDISAVYKNPELHYQWDSFGSDRQMTFDGVLLHTPLLADGAVAYVHFYRNGTLEAVHTSLLETQQVPGKRLIPHVKYERTVLTYLPRCFQSLERLGVRPPLSVALSLVGVQGLRMAGDILNPNDSREIREETLIIPGRIVESFSETPERILKPIFDRVWNACGVLESENFDQQGNWAPRRR